MAKVAAHNIASSNRGKVESDLKDLPFAEINVLCVLGAGKQGVIMISDHIFVPRKYQMFIPSPWSHWAKILFEKYYLWKMRKGFMYLL